MREIHILAGIVSLFAGFVALYAAKGGWLHRRSGRLFTGAMLVLAATGAITAAFVHPNRVNVNAGTLTFYLVATGLLAVIRRVADARALLVALAVAAAAASLAAWVLAAMAAGAADGKIDHMPAGPLYMFGIVGTLGVLGDLRLLLGRVLSPPQRLTRHLWRMGYAFWIATLSFFLGQAKFLPAGFRAAHWNAVPVVLVLGTLVYWLLRVWVFKQVPGRGASQRRAGPIAPPLAD
jgi:uncharacterized membrane protein